MTGPSRMLDHAVAPPPDIAEHARTAANGTDRARPLFLCFSHLRWDFVWQRPQHLLTRAARSHDVVFVEEPVHQPVPKPVLDVSGRTENVRVLVPILPEGMSGADAEAAQKLLVEAFLGGARARVLWFYTPMATPLAEGIAADVVVYDNMDELSAFRGASPELLAREAALFRRADLVFTGGVSLWEAKRGRHPHVFAFPSSIDVPHFAAARDRPAAEPADQAGIGRPRIGFFGVIDERLDTELVRDLAARRPDWQFVMLGPVVKIDAAALPRGPNLHWLGAKGYGELPSYLAGWDVGFMPFALNESTRFISPTKTPEFLSAGLPLVSTPIADVVRPYGEAGLVGIASGAEAFAAALDDRLAAPPPPGWRENVDHHLASSSWDRTWDAMNRTIDDALFDRCGSAEAEVGCTIG